MVILNHNLIEIEATEIHSTQVQQTVFEGRVVHQVE